MRVLLFSLLIITNVGRSLGQLQLNRPSDLLVKLCLRNNTNIDDAILLQNVQTGAFRDIHYNDSAMANWGPANHLQRLRKYSEAYICPQSKYYQSAAVYERIIKGLILWIQNNPTSKNWWYNQIKSPLDIGQLLINMQFGYKQLPDEIESACIDIMRFAVENPLLFVGANRTDIATHWIYRACLTDNDALLREALNLVDSSIRYSRYEGITVDNGYCQHNRQMYVGAYGSSFLLETTKWAYLLKDTQFALSNEKINILSRFARKTFFPTIRGGHFSYNVCGRGISRKGAIRISGTPEVIAKRLSLLDTLHKEQYSEIIRDLTSKHTHISKQHPSHTHYYYTDYTLHSTPKFTFDIKMCSKRTPRCESINNENLKNYFLSRGGTCLMISGNEYDDIFPVWDWSRIPGVTAPHLPNVPTISGITSYGETDFAGGVSDSIHGVSSYIYNDCEMKTQAKKSWFFFENIIVCLGSDISSDSEYPIETSINQCLDNSKCFIRSYRNNQISVLGQCKDSCLRHPEMVIHGDVGYYFPLCEDIIISKENRTGSWYDINRRYDKSSEKKEVFYIGINHGKFPKESRYSYILIPGINNMINLEKEVANLSVKILCCDKDKHIVYDSDSKILQAVFFYPGFLKYKDLYLKVDQPCALIVHLNHLDRPKTLHLSNVSQIKKNISVLYKYRDQIKNIIVKTTDLAYAGRTQCFNLW